MAIQKLITTELFYEKTGQQIDGARISPSFVIEDTIDILGRVYGKNLTGLSAKLSACLRLSDGTISAPIFTKNSSQGGGIVLTSISNSAYSVRISVASSDTSVFEAGQEIVFDVEFSTTTIPPIKRTVKGSFVLEDQYTTD